MATYDGKDAVEVDAVKTNMPKARGKLKPDDEYRLRVNYSFLVGEIDAQYLAPQLFSEFVLDEDDKQKILSKATASERTKSFLDILLHSGPGEAYNKFVEVLTAVYPKVAEKLKETPDKGALQPSYAPGTQHSSQEATKSQGTSTSGHNDQSTEIYGQGGLKSKNKNLVSPSTPEAGKEEVKNKSAERAPKNEYKEYLEFIEKEIPDDIDILIISHEDDIDMARNLKENIENNVRFTIYDKSIVPLVEIKSDILGFAPKILDQALGRALFIFLFATENFCNQDLNLLEAYACLQKTLSDEKQKKILIPVHTSPKEGRPYTLPCELGGLRSLYCGDREFFSNVRKLLENEKSTIANKLIYLDERRNEYYAKNRQGLKKQKAIMDLLSAKSSKEDKSSAFPAPNRNVPADEVSSLSHAVEDIKIRQDTDTERRQLVQSHANYVSQNSSDTEQSSIDKE